MAGIGQRAINRLALVAWTCCLLPVLAFGSAQPWPHELSSLDPHPEVVWEKLENGFRYALLPRETAPGEISMRLMVGVGSLDEEESERGLAHFVEHMAFEGSRTFEPGAMTAFFQRLGMRYGGDINAFTHHDKTVYHLELPDNDAGLVQQSLNLFRDYADGMSMPEDRILAQREVIARERLARETSNAMIAREAMRFAFAGTQLAERDPIGTPEVVNGATRELLMAFYRKWYRPDLMTLVVVGDFAAEEMAGHVSATFADINLPAEERPQRTIGRLASNPQFNTRAIEVPALERNVLKVSRTWNDKPSIDSWETRRVELARRFATELLDDRFRRAVDGVGEQFARYERVLGIPYAQLSISAGPEVEEKGFLWVDRLLRQILDHGFLPDEVELLRKSWEQSARADLARRSSSAPRVEIDRLVTHIAEGRVYLAPEMEREFTARFLNEMDLATVEAAAAEVWQLRELSYFVAGSFEKVPDRRSVRSLLRQDRQFEAPAYAGTTSGLIEYTALGAKGEVIEREAIESAGATAYRFSNNVRLTILPTDHEPGTARGLVRVGAGLLAFDGVNPATPALAMPSLFRSGFGSRDAEDVYSALRSSVISFVFGVEDHDAFSYRAVATREGMEQFFRIVAEYLIDPRLDDAAFDISRLKLRQSRESEADGSAEAYRHLLRLLYPGQPRFHSPTLSEIDAASAAEARQWLEAEFRDGCVEVVVVGDVEEGEVVDWVARTFGALPTRRADREAFQSDRFADLPLEKGRRRISYARGTGDAAAAVMVWPMPAQASARDRAGALLLSAVLETRLREQVRDRMGASYSQSVDFVTHSAYQGLSHIRADVDCASEDTEKVLTAMSDLAGELRQEVITKEELAAAVAPLEASIRSSWRDNAFLLDKVLAHSFERPEAVEEAAALRAGELSTFTPRELRRLARRYFMAEEALSVAIVPESDFDIAARLDAEAAIAPAAATGRR